MLHEGLGSVGLWGDFPDRLAAATGCGVFAYSRAGYGASSPVKLPRPLDYMHVEALEVLPKLLDAIGFRRGLLVGHSDGASIAAIYAGGVQDHRIRGLSLIAPHFIVEDISVSFDRRRSGRTTSRAICAQNSRAGTAMSTMPSTAGMAPGSTRNSATGISPSISPTSACRCRSCRATGDQYGTLRQIEVAQEECYCPVDVAMIARRRAFAASGSAGRHASRPSPASQTVSCRAMGRAFAGRAA